MSTPRVSYGPVLGTIGVNTVSYDWNVVYNIRVTGLVMEDSAGIVLKSVWNSNTTCNGASLINFLHHFCFSWYLSVLVSMEDLIRIWSVAFHCARITSFTLNISWAFLAVIMASCSVNGASLIRCLICMHPFKSIKSFTSVAALITTAGDKHLRSNVNVRPSCTSCNLDSIRHSWCSCMCPTWTAVRWYVLISYIGQEIGAVHAIPDEGVG